MAVLDASVVNVAAPAIHAELHASGAGLQLVIAGYVITYAVLLVTGARLGDIVGHRRMFLAGLATVHPGLARLRPGHRPPACSSPCGFIQGAGAAAMIPQVLSLIQRTFTGTSAGRRDAAVRRGHRRRRGRRAGRRRAAGHREPVRQRLAGRCSSSTSRSGVALLATGGSHAAARCRGPQARRWTWPAWRCSPRPRWPSCCRWSSGSPSTGPCGAGSAWPASVLLFGLFAVVERRVAARGGSPADPWPRAARPARGRGWEWRPCS